MNPPAPAPVNRGRNPDFAFGHLTHKGCVDGSSESVRTCEGGMLDRSHASSHSIRDAFGAMTMRSDETLFTTCGFHDRKHLRKIELRVASTAARREDSARRHHLNPIAFCLNLKCDHAIDLDTRRDAATPKCTMPIGRRQWLTTTKQARTDQLPACNCIAHSVLTMKTTTAIACRSDTRRKHLTCPPCHGAAAQLPRYFELLLRRSQCGIEFEMHVRIDQPRHDHSAGQIDRLQSIDLRCPVASRISLFETPVQNT